MKKGWEIKRLGEVCNLSAGGDMPKDDFSEFQTDERRIPIYANGEKNNGLYGYTSIAKITRPSITVSARGTIGFSVKRLESFYPIVRLITITPKDLSFLDLSFLDYAIKSIDFKHSGSSIPQLTVPMIRDYGIPLPQLPEQQRIVSMLDEVFSAIERSRNNAEQNLRNVKELFESYLQGVFENPKDNWEKKKWGDLCHFVRGPFGGSLKKSIFKEDGYVVYEQKHAIHDHFNQLRYFIDEDKFNEMMRFEIKPGDIIMSCSGVTLGRVAIVPENIKRGIINQALLKLTPKKNVSVHFLKHWLRSTIFQDIIFEYSGGAAIPNVPSAKILKDIFIPLPSLKKQNEVVNNIELMLTETKRLEAIYQQKILDLDELKKSVLQKAFSGELTSLGFAEKVILTMPLPLQKVERISTTDLQAGITAIALMEHVQKDKLHTLHHVKAEKIVHLSEYILNVDLERNPVKDAAGPNDFPHAKKVESRAQKAGFYKVVKNGDYYDYQQGHSINNIIQKTKNCLGEKTNILINLLNLLIPMSTQQAEIVATVYAAWNNLILAENDFSTEDIVTEARENWHKKKEDIPREKFFNAINWMKKYEFLIPIGNGKLVKTKSL
jgi:type I restriction enzyme S subunit